MLICPTVAELPLGQYLLHLVEVFFRDDGRNAIWHNNHVFRHIVTMRVTLLRVRICRDSTIVSIESLIFGISQNLVKRILAECLICLCPISSGLQCLDDGIVALPLQEHLEDEPYGSRFMLIDYEETRGFVHVIAQWGDTAGMFAMESILLQPLPHFTRKVSAIKFIHAFDD